MAVIKDVAREAGLSVAAVSKYLKDPGSVLPSTREKVEAAIAKLHYQPSPTARALRTGVNRLVAVMVQDLTNPFYAELFEAIRRELAAQGYGALVFSNEPGSQSAYAQALRMVDGIILCFLYDEKAADVPALPTVALGWRPFGAGRDAIVLPMRPGMQAVTTHLIARGCTRIGYVGTRGDDVNARDKFRGYRDALRAVGREPNPRDLCMDSVTLADGYRAARTLLDRPDRPDALVCENDILAIGCLKYCRRHGLAVPGDVAVTGHDAIAMAQMLEPPLTTVRLPIGDMGAAAATLMLSRLEGREEDVRQDFAAEIMVRGTTNCYYQQKLDDL